MATASLNLTNVTNISSRKLDSDLGCLKLKAACGFSKNFSSSKSTSKPNKRLSVRASEDQGNVKSKRKFITKGEEPEQYWQTASERDGKSPMQTLQPYIALLGLLTPFIILGIAFANGYIKTP